MNPHHGTTPLARLGRGVKAATAAVGLAVLLAGVPWGLVRHIGWPLPAGVPTWDELSVFLTTPLTDEVLLKVLACVLWLAWADFTLDVAVAAVAELRGVPPPRLPGGPLQALATAMVGAVLAGMLSTIARGATTAPGLDIAEPRPAATAVLLDADDPSGLPAGRSVDAAVVRPATATGQIILSTVADPAGAGRYTVRPGDSLWDIAASQLDDPWRWREIYVLNRGVPQAGGGALTEPDLIRPGWILRMPTDPDDTRATGPQDTPAPRHTVSEGDTLWDIAADRLGDPKRWTEIHRLNQDRHDMRGGSHIEPGWVLLLPQQTPPDTPSDDTTPGSGRPGTPSPPPTSAPSPTPTPQPSQTPPARPGDDGVAGPPGGAGTTPATPAPPPSADPTRPSTPTTTAPPKADDTPAAQRPGVTLPSGCWVDLGLAAALLAAVALVWALRRRRYTPRPPSADPRLDDPDLAPLPATVTSLRRAVRAATGQTDDDYPADPDHPTAPATPPRRNGAADAPFHDVHDGETTENAELPDNTLGGLVGSDRAAVTAPGLDGPLADVWPPTGLGLVGPGAHAAARGFLTAALAAGGVDDPHARSQVVIPAATLATLLGADAVSIPDTPRLTVTPGLPEALDALDQATLHRTRLAYEHEADTVADIRRDDPTEEPLPPLLLIADAAAAHERARIAALLTQGQRLDIHGILLGPWPTGDTLHVGADGAAAPANPAPRHGAHPADIGRLAVLTPRETADLLAALAESHTGSTPSPPPAETAPPDSQDHADGQGTPAGEPTPGEHPSHAAAADSAGPVEPTEPGDAEEQPVIRAAHSPAEASDAARAARHPQPARASVLGRPRIHYNQPPPKEPFRSKARELLVYLAVNPNGATTKAILEDVFGDVPRSKANHRLHVCVSNLRVHLTHADGDNSSSTYVEHPDRRYVLHPDDVDVDLHRMQRALTDADAAPDPATRAQALRRAVDAYTGPLADGCEYDWIEPHREATRRQALDAHIALADTLANTDPDQAVHVLHAAIEHGPRDEHIYQQAMRLHAAQGDLQGVRALLRTLTQHLAEIDAEPDEETSELTNKLIGQLRRQKSR